MLRTASFILCLLKILSTYWEELFNTDIRPIMYTVVMRNTFTYSLLLFLTTLECYINCIMKYLYIKEGADRGVFLDSLHSISTVLFVSF